MNYLPGSFMMASLAPRSVNTVATFLEKKNMIEKKDTNVLVLPCINMHIEVGGSGALTGTLTRIDNEASLASTELASENIFNGISICRCYGDEESLRNVASNTSEVIAALQKVASGGETFPRLEELLPASQQTDFWWADNVCISKINDKVRKAVTSDYENDRLSFYDMYQVEQRPSEEQNDHALRDGCAWKPAVRNGMLGVFEQKNGTRPGVYLACVSAIPSLGSELVRAVRSDVMGHCTAYDFVDSKEAWFLETFAQRNRQRLLAAAAKAIGVRVHTTPDAWAHESQRDEELAVESCGVLYESLYIDESSPQVSVVHAKGCVDAARGIGPVPVWMGQGHPIITFLPDHALRSNDSVENDNSRFLLRASCERVEPFPVVNIVEENLGNTVRVEAETDHMWRLSMQDVAQNIHTHHGLVDKDSAAFLGMQDSYGLPMFYAIKYDEPLPLVLFPTFFPRFTVIEDHIVTRVLKTDSTVSSRRRQRQLYTSGKLSNRLVAENLFMSRKHTEFQLEDKFGFLDRRAENENKHAVLVWDNNVSSLVSRITSDGRHAADSVTMTQLACVCV